MNAESEYGSSFFNNLSLDLKTIIPAAKCFSPTNLSYMKRFYELVSDASEKLPQVGAELLSIPWGHIKLLIDKCKNEPKKYCFIPAKLLKITGPAQSCRIGWIQIFMNVRAKLLPILP